MKVQPVNYNNSTAFGLKADRKVLYKMLENCGKFLPNEEAGVRLLNKVKKSAPDTFELTDFRLGHYTASISSQKTDKFFIKAQLKFKNKHYDFAEEKTYTEMPDATLAGVFPEIIERSIQRAVEKAQESAKDFINFDGIINKSDWVQKI